MTGFCGHIVRTYISSFPFQDLKQMFKGLPYQRLQKGWQRVRTILEGLGQWLEVTERNEKGNINW